MNKKISALALLVSTAVSASMSYALNTEIKEGTILKGVIETDLVSVSMDDHKSIAIRVGGTSCVVNAQGSLYPTGRIHIGISDMICKNGTKVQSTKVFGYIFDPQSKATGMISECLEYRTIPNNKTNRPGPCIKAKLNAKTPVLIQLTQAVELK